MNIDLNLGVRHRSGDVCHWSLQSLGRVGEMSTWTCSLHTMKNKHPFSSLFCCDRPDFFFFFQCSVQRVLSGCGTVWSLLLQKFTVTGILSNIFQLDLTWLDFLTGPPKAPVCEDAAKREKEMSQWLSKHIVYYGCIFVEHAIWVSPFALCLFCLSLSSDIFFRTWTVW